MLTTYNISAGQTDNNLTLGFGDTANVYSGGIATSVTVGLGATLTVYSGGVVNDVVNSGWETLNGGVDSHGTINFGGYLEISAGVAYGDTVQGGGYQMVESSGIASGTVINNSGYNDGYQEVDSGGVANNTTVQGGYQSIESGGVCNSSVITSGYQNVDSGGVANNSVIYAGYLNIDDGVTYGDVLHGGNDSVSDGGVANNVTVDSGATEAAISGGQVSSSVVNSGGTEQVFGGGLITAVTVNNGGTLEVYSGGEVNDITLNSGGTLEVYSGGVISGSTLLSGGTEDVHSGSSINGVSVQSGAIVNNENSGSGGNGGGSITLNGNDDTVNVPLGYTGSIFGFNATDKLDLLNVGKATAVSWSNNVLAVKLSSGTVDVSLLGNYQGDIFAFTSDNNGGTLLTLKPPTLTQVSYNAANGELTLSGANLSASAYTLSDLSLKGDANSLYTLSSASTLIGSPTPSSLTLQLSATDQLAVNGLFNKNGSKAIDADAYSLSASSNWISGGTAISSAAVSVNHVAAPTLSAVSYNAATGVLSLTGNNLDNHGASNGINLADLKITAGTGSYSFSASNDTVSNLSATGFNITLGNADLNTVNALLNNNGNLTASNTAYKLSLSSGWDSDSGSTISNNIGVSVNGVALQTLTTAGPFPPISLAVDKAGDVYFGNYFAGSFDELLASTDKVTSVGKIYIDGNPTGIAIDKTGNIYIANTNSDIFTEIAAGSKTATVLMLSNQASLWLPAGLAVDASGNLYASYNDPGSIQKIAAGSHKVSTLLSIGLNAPESLVVQGTNLYIDDAGDGLIKELSLTTHKLNTLCTVPSFGAQKNAIAVDTAGNVYITNNTDNSIQELVAGTHTPVTLLSSGLNHPDAITVDSYGNLYIVNSGDNTIDKLAHADYLLNTKPSNTAPVTINNLWENTGQIELSKAIYTAFAGASTVSASHFSNATAATGSSDFLYYNANTGGLYYDAHGSTTPNAAVEIALIGVNSHPAALSIGDFKLTA